MRIFLHTTLLIIVLLLPMKSMVAQDTDSLDLKGNIIQDHRVEVLVMKHVKINQVTKDMDGFRIQLFSDSGNNSKGSAQTVYDEFVLKYPTVGAYLTFKSPNYKVRIGDFRTRLDAQRFLNELTVDYPNAFIVAETINLPRIE